MQTQNLINLSLLLLSVKLKPSANKNLLDFALRTQILFQDLVETTNLI